MSTEADNLSTAFDLLLGVSLGVGLFPHVSMVSWNSDPIA